MRTSFLLLLLPLWLAACGPAEPIWAPQADVDRAIQPNTGPTEITLVTVISNKGNAGAHTGLKIDNSQHVLFDPAGTFKYPYMPERNDLIYGVTPQRWEIYVDYHARVTFRVVLQELKVSPETAELIFRRAQAYGAVPKAHCADSISQILAGVPGFESITPTMFPKRLMNEFARLPGVSERTVYDEDADDNRYVIYKQVGEETGG